MRSGIENPLDTKRPINVLNHELLHDVEDPHQRIIQHNHTTTVQERNLILLHTSQQRPNEHYRRYRDTHGNDDGRFQEHSSERAREGSHQRT